MATNSVVKGSSQCEWCVYYNTIHIEHLANCFSFSDIHTCVRLLQTYHEILCYMYVVPHFHCISKCAVVAVAVFAN